MSSGLSSLIAAWNNVGIVAGFIRTLKSAMAILGRRSDQPRELASPTELGDAFFGDWLEFGDVVEVVGRLSRYAPIYFPIAYSPQAHMAFRTPGGGTQGGLIMNPAPARSRLRFVDGAVMAFLFNAECPETPRITSPVHLDRVALVSPSGETRLPLPYTRADASVPVLLDESQLQHLEQRVELRARLRPLPSEIETEIADSNEDFVRLYYHGFYRDAAFPEPGFVLDARSRAGGAVRNVGHPSPFHASVGVELAFETGLSEDDFEGAVAQALKAIAPHPHMDGTGHRYQPAYHTPDGYKVVQLSRSPLLAHVAFSKRALHFSMPVDTTGDASDVDGWFRPSVAELCGRLAESDHELRLSPLFLSDDRLDPT